MTLRILHHNDPDGYASAYIVYDYMMKSDVDPSMKDIHFHSMAYGQPVPAEIDYEKDHLVMVDFSLQPLAVMDEFVAKIPWDQFVWIDHHQTAVILEAALTQRDMPIPGIRMTHDAQGVPLAACELTWKFFYPTEEVPIGISLLGGWDTWRYVTQNDMRSKYFIQYCNSTDCTPATDEGQEFWGRVIVANEDPYGWLMDTVLKEGAAVDRFRTIDNRKTIQGKGFLGKFAGHSAIIVNAFGSSLLFEDFTVHPSEVDLMVSFHYTPHGYWTVSMYSVQEGVNCGAIAKMVGEAGPRPSGGGHKGAAGFQCDWPYIESLIERVE